MILRTATAADAAWIDEQYAVARFLSSDLGRDVVVIAEVDGQRAGIGRLVPAGDGAFELGGMWVLDAFRGRGIARANVEELIRRAHDATLFCIPFADLEAFYASTGFQRIGREGAPAKVQEKLAWCDREVKREVLLMKMS